MADLASDKQIQELLYTQLGLQQKSEALFRDLTKADFHDPLDDIFKSINNKTQ
jgi:DNA polymerase I-like protein with 3'-5' exonuclease and polymerase domains